MRRAGHIAAGAVAVVTTLALAGCGDVRPGAAATVDGVAIPLGRVDEMAEAFCAAELVIEEQTNGESERRFQTAAGYRELVLSTLVNAELAEDISAELGLDVPAADYSTDLTQLDEQFADLSASDVEALQDFIVAFTKLLALTAAIGEDRGDAEVVQDPLQAFSDGYLVQLADGADIELDPRFGELRKGRLVGGSGSLSAPSDDESGGGSDDLPASQTCA